MDVIAMAAAVGDYRPLEVTPQKIKKTSEHLDITLVRNPDILATLGQSKFKHQILVGFAAETENLVENAKQKLKKKNLDFIVANDLFQSGAGFGSDTNQVKIIDGDGRITELPRLSKGEVADRILGRIEQLL
jgi:phosphopantothenoylcysteine decarboxylase/phosphopantothenate--cysteine ligase